MWSYLVICFIWLASASLAKVGSVWEGTSFRVGLRVILIAASLGTGVLEYLSFKLESSALLVASLFFNTFAVVGVYYFGATILLTRKVSE